MLWPFHHSRISPLHRGELELVILPVAGQCPAAQAYAAEDRLASPVSTHHRELEAGHADEPEDAEGVLAVWHLRCGAPHRAGAVLFV